MSDQVIILDVNGEVHVMAPVLENNFVHLVTGEWISIPPKYTVHLFSSKEYDPESFVFDPYSEVVLLDYRRVTVEDIAAKDVPEGIDYEIVQRAEIPADRTFRNAWKKDGKGIAVDMPKAKEIWVNHWRLAREPLLKEADVEFTKALGQKNQQKADQAEAKRQALRDVTLTDLSAVTTPEDLKKIWPSALGQKPSHL
jgi:hypothetical protein